VNINRSSTEPHWFFSHVKPQLMYELMNAYQSTSEWPQKSPANRILNYPECISLKVVTHTFLTHLTIL